MVKQNAIMGASEKHDEIETIMVVCECVCCLRMVAMYKCCAILGGSLAIFATVSRSP